MIDDTYDEEWRDGYEAARRKFDPRTEREKYQDLLDAIVEGARP